MGKKFKYSFIPKLNLGEADKFDLWYEYPPSPPDEEIENFGLPLSEQIFKRVIIPDYFDDIDYDDDGDAVLKTKEQQSFFLREINRRRNGHWYFIGGRKIFITGHHYFYLNYWWMDAEGNDGFPEFRWGNALLFYVIDYVFKNPKILGLLFLCRKRAGKTETFLSICYNLATLTTNRLCRLMSLKRETADINLFTKIKRSWIVMFPPFRPVHSGSTDPKDKLFFSTPSKRGSKKVKQQREFLGNAKKQPLNSVIQTVETKISAVQGEKPHYVFVDEAASIIEMDLIKFATTAREQLHLGFTTIIGKLFMPCTLEELNESGVPAYQKLWLGSNPKDLENRVRTESGFIRYYQPAWMALEGHIDKFGFPMEKEAKDIIKKIIDEASPQDQLKLKRQYSSTAEEAFGLVSESGLEEASLLVLNEVEQMIDLEPNKMGRYKFYEYNNEVRAEPAQGDTGIVEVYHGDLSVKEHCTYIISVDGTASDKKTNSVKTRDKKSKIAVGVFKTFDGIDQRNYCDIATYCEEPTNLDDSYRIIFCMWKHYNKYGKCRINVEYAVGTVPAMYSFFCNKNSGKAFLKQLKYPGTNNFETVERIGTSRTGNVPEIQLFLTNRWVQAHGHHFRNKRLIHDLKMTGSGNRDLSSMAQLAVLCFGKFYHDANEVEIEKPKPEPTGHFDQNLRRWIWGYTDEKGKFVEVSKK